MSPPASNENDYQNQHPRTPLSNVRMTGGGGNYYASSATVNNAGGAAGGGPIDCYPTPPSAEPLHHAQFSPPEQPPSPLPTAPQLMAPAPQNYSHHHHHPHHASPLNVCLPPYAAQLPASNKFNGSFQPRAIKLAADWLANAANKTLRYTVKPKPSKTARRNSPASGSNAPPGVGRPPSVQPYARQPSTPYQR